MNLDQDRLLAEVELEPIQGKRFQPTGFPSLGAAEYTSINDGKSVSTILLESAQSMANRLEMVCMNGSKDSIVPTLEGLPVITLHDSKGKFITNSILEAHRMNSPYLLVKDNELYKKINAEFNSKNEAADIQKFAKFVFKYDTNALVHGLFLVSHKETEGRYKLTRILSSFIEAVNANPAISGGVKIDRLDPSGGKKEGGDEKGSSKGFGHVPYSRIEYTAESIKAYFDIDMALIRSYGLPETANEFLFTFALWKIQSFLSSGLRLRTACNLRIKNTLTATQPNSVKIPKLDKLDSDLKSLLKKCKKEELFCKSPIALKRKQ